MTHDKHSIEKEVHKVKINEVDKQTPAEGNDMEAEEFATEIESLQGELEQLRKSADESRDHYLRVLADFDNFRKRQRDEISRRISIEREEFINKLFPVIDNFNRALESAEAQHSYESLVEGVSLTLRQINDILEKEGVQPIESVGQEFNPELHEAIMRTETDEFPENTIIEEFEKGFTINGRVLRPSRVRVAVAASE